jgi:hypothetical protein
MEGRRRSERVFWRLCLQDASAVAVELSCWLGGWVVGQWQTGTAVYLPVKGKTHVLIARMSEINLFKATKCCAGLFSLGQEQQQYAAAISGTTPAPLTSGNAQQVSL